MSNGSPLKLLRAPLALISGLAVLASSMMVASPALAKAHVNKQYSSVCEADVAVIGVRGSGQDLENTYRKKSEGFFGFIDVAKNAGVDSYKVFQGTPAQNTGDVTDNIEGFSDEVATAAFELRKQFPDSLRFHFVPVEYEAVEATNAVMNKDKYDTSYRGGAELITEKVKEAAGCVTTEIVIIGFSQGAQATHEALSMLSSKERDRIASVILIADPFRSPGDKTGQNYNEDGDKVTDDPLIRGFGAFSQESDMGNNPPSLPSDMDERILSVCSKGDVVCAATSFETSRAVKSSTGFAMPVISALRGGTHHGEVYRDTKHNKLWEVPAKWAHGLISKNLLSDRVVRSGSGGGINPYKHFSKTILCPDVNFIFAGGQYDDPVGGQSGEGAGLQLAADIPAEMLDGIVKATPGKTIGIKGARYDADGTYGLDENGGDEDYRTNTQSGIDATKKAIKESMEECKDTRMILFGNEQGAQVMHEVVAKGLDKDQLSKIDAVILMADPMRSGEDAAVKEFAGVNGQTMGDDASSLYETGGRLKEHAKSKGVLNFPSELNGKVMSICASADGLCNPDPKNPDEGGGYMGAYNMFGTFWEEPAKWASDLIKK